MLLFFLGFLSNQTEVFQAEELFKILQKVPSNRKMNKQAVAAV